MDRQRGVAAQNITIHTPSRDSFAFDAACGLLSPTGSTSTFSPGTATVESPVDAFTAFKLQKLVLSSTPAARFAVLELLLRSADTTTLETYRDLVDNYCSRALGPKPLCKTSIRALPDEVLLLVFAHLDARGTRAAALVCRRWSRVLHDETLWQQLCETHGFVAPIQHHFATLRAAGLRSLAAVASRPISRESALTRGLRAAAAAQTVQPVHADAWKTQFRDSYLTWCNWRWGRFRAAAVHDWRTGVRGGAGGLCVGFDDGLVRSVALEANGHLWDMTTGVVALQLRGHVGLITTVQFVGDRIVTGGVDATVRLWDAQSGALLGTLEGHTGEIVSLQCKNGVIVSGAEDATLRLWDCASGAALGVLAGHSGAVTALHVHGNIVSSGSTDQTVRLWTLDSHQCERTLEGHHGTVYAVQHDATCVVSGSEDRTLAVWSVASGQRLQTLRGHRGAVVCLQFDADKIVSGSTDGAVRVWDRATGAPRYQLCEHSAGIWNLRFDRTKLMTTSFDQSVRVWDFASVSGSLDIRRVGSDESGRSDESGDLVVHRRPLFTAARSL